MFAKNGFQNVAEKIRLGRFLIERLSNPNVDRFSPAERMRMAFEELGPTFIKLGQLLATRPDLVPPDFVDEFKKLHDQAQTVSFTEIQRILERQFHTGLAEIFTEIDPVPLAAASIAQVHRATLARDGTEVVVKVKRPGIEHVIANDVGILYYLAELLQKYVPESRPFNPIAIVDEFFKTLELETNFIVEANNIRRFQENFAGDANVKIPEVYFDYSGKNVLVLEAVKGIPLSQKRALEQEGIDRQKVVRAGLRAYFKMVFKDGLFHGDLHAGNIFILPDNRIGMIDFGIVGRLNRRVQDAIANMFVALYTEDYERLAYEYVELAPYNDEVDVDAFAKDLQDLLAPHFGLSMKNVDLGRLLMDSTGVAARYSLVLPSDLMLFFKSIVTVEGMAHVIVKDFNLLDHALEFAEDLVKTKYSPDRLRDEAMAFGADATALMKTFPRQLKQLMRKINHPEFAFRLNLVEFDELKRSIETSSNIVFLGLIIGSLVLSGTATLFLERQSIFLGMPMISASLYGFATLLGAVAFYNYIRK